MKSLLSRLAPFLLVMSCGCTGLGTITANSAGVIVAPRLDVRLPSSLLERAIFLGPVHLMLGNGGSLSIVAVRDIEFDFLHDIRLLPAYVMGFSELDTLGSLSEAQTEVVKGVKAVVRRQFAEDAALIRQTHGNRTVLAALGKERSVGYIISTQHPTSVLYLHAKSVDPETVYGILTGGEH